MLAVKGFANPFEFYVHAGHAGDKTKMRCHKIATCSWVNDSDVGEARYVVELFKSDTLVCDSLHLRETRIMSTIPQ